LAKRTSNGLKAIGSPQVTQQVDSGRNLLKKQSLQELASALGLTIAQVTPQVTAQVEKVLDAILPQSVAEFAGQRQVGLDPEKQVFISSEKRDIISD
jgi:hypothetical protein